MMNQEFKIYGGESLVAELKTLTEALEYLHKLSVDDPSAEYKLVCEMSIDGEPIGQATIVIESVEDE